MQIDFLDTINDVVKYDFNILIECVNLKELVGMLRRLAR